MDGKARFLYSGEVHYFRIDPADWPARLRQAKKAGLNAVSTYVPWRWHETSPGVYDFYGATDGKRDLQRWIRLTQEAGLDLILRLGPICNGEMKYEGLPDRIAKDPRACENPPDALHHTTAPGYLNDAFWKPSRHWLRSLLPIVVAAQADRGGPVILVQMDNEIGMVHWVSGLPLSSTYFARYFDQLQKEARTAGVTVPLVANIPQFYDYDTRGRGNWAPLTSALFEQFEKSGCQVMGGAYQPRRLDAENGHDIHLATEAVRSVQENSIAFCAETQVGMLFDRPRLYPKDTALLLRLASIAGLRGLNLYMFAGGENPDGLGAFGKRHDWQSPVGPEGDERPHYAEVAAFGREMSRVEQLLAEGEPWAPVDLAVPRLYYLDPKSPNLEDARHFLFDGSARLLWLAGLPPRWKWLGQPRTRLHSGPRLSAKTIFLFSLETMDAASQKEAAAAVKAGATLILGPALPVKDEKGRPCTILADALGLSADPRPTTDGNSFVGGTMVLNFRRPSPVIMKRGGDVVATCGDSVIGASMKVGKGRALYLGIPLSDRQGAQQEAFSGILSGLGLRPLVTFETAGRPAGSHADTPVALVKRRGKRSLILVANLHETDWKGTITAGSGRDSATVKVALSGRTAYFYHHEGGRIWPA